MKVWEFDHVSLPAKDVEACIAFYRRLGFPILYEDEWRRGEVRWVGIQVDEHVKINVHPPEMWQNERFTLRAPRALARLRRPLLLLRRDNRRGGGVPHGRGGADRISVLVKQRGGADAGRRQGESVYTRDPDGNLLEFMTYPPPKGS